MLIARDWTCELVDRLGAKRRATASAVTVVDDTVCVSFSGVPSQPEHVAIGWRGAPILSVVEMGARRSKLTYNPGELVWDEDARELRFVANPDELSAVCDGTDRAPEP